MATKKKILGANAIYIHKKRKMWKENAIVTLKKFPHASKITV